MQLPQAACCQRFCLNCLTAAGVSLTMEFNQLLFAQTVLELSAERQASLDKENIM
jgi:hypothetical protein